MSVHPLEEKAKRILSEAVAEGPRAMEAARAKYGFIPLDTFSAASGLTQRQCAEILYGTTSAEPDRVQSWPTSASPGVVAEVAKEAWDDRQAASQEFARMVERVEDMEAALREAQQRVRTLTHERDVAIREVGNLGAKMGTVQSERDRIEQERDACLARAQDAERDAKSDDGTRGNLLIFGAGAVAVAVLIFTGVIGGAG